MAERTVRIEDNPETAYERSDWPLGRMGLVFLGIFIFLVAAPLVLYLAFPQAVSDVNRNLTVVPPAPRLQTNPATDLARFRSEEEKRLDTYYWVDKQKGVIHIPIAQAMRKLAHDGIGGFPREQR